MTRPHGHIVVLHRWRDRHAHYADYLDHDAYRVSYVTTRLGLASVPAAAAAVAEVSATDSLAETTAAVAALAERLGPVRRLVALNEGDLDTAAALRAGFALPGQSAQELERFRDKLTMVTLVDRAGIAVPRYGDAVSRESVREFARSNGWPVVVKPRRGTASRGVAVLRGPADLDASALFDGASSESRIAQSFVADPVFHVDGLWTGSALGPWRASRYVNSCHDFTEGAFLGSVEVDEPELLPPLADFTAAVGEALGEGRPWVFHLEVFVGSGEDGAPRLTFLEAGARVGGGEIPFVWREVHGLDLMAAAADIQMDRPPAVPATGSAPGGTAGWLLLPMPVPAPCRVVEVTRVPDLTGPESGPYARVVPEPGTVIPRTGGYEHVAARFRFRGSSSREVEAAIEKTAGAFTVRCESLPVPAPQPAKEM
ncbi:biotin carboxylase [Streptomyces sp. AM 4-1-1]|uniref:ATP-grasp domain-containing protein n=1 Tax=Streptomyces sp. AM 4-1-1 TaxID=3028710 RepID=UPI0023B9B4AA|nr:biotin carboxylase [Streptomyces sp. AM 4-1-1]WEH35263.1 biotin carboxylase [Streptomyces sp. AM 4-1-1]